MSVSTTLSRRHQVAGYLVVYSALMAVFAVIELNLFDNTPAGKFTTGPYPPALGLAAASSLLLMAVVGLGLSTAQYVYDVGSPAVTLIALVLEGICGWFVFIALPTTSSAVAAQHAPTSTVRASIMMGMLGSWSMGIPLLGAKFFFTLMLHRAQSSNAGKLEVYSVGYYASRAAFYSFFLILKGVAEISFAAISALPAIHPPLAIFDKNIAYGDGAIVIAVGLWAMTISLLRIPGQGKSFGVIAFLCWILQLCLMSVAQLSKTPPKPHPFPADVVGAAQAALLTSMMLMPAYLIESMDNASKTGATSAEDGEKTVDV